MSATRKAAGGLTVLESLWTFFILYSAPPVACPLNGCAGPQFSGLFTDGLTAFAILTLLVGVLGLWGASFAFPAGAALSVLLLLTMGYLAWADASVSYLAAESYKGVVGAVVAALALTANLFGMRSRSRLSEQANPMNLPVFG